MKKRRSAVKTVFVNIDDMASTVENIHGGSSGKQSDKNRKNIRRVKKKKYVYSAIRSINGRIGRFVSDFF